MQNLKSIVSVFILLSLAIINVSAQTQTSRSTDRQVGVILQRLDRTSARFRNSLNTALAQQRIDQTRSGNDINTFRSEFEQSTVQLRDQFNQRRAAASDVENVLRSASRVNEFMTRTPLNRRAQSDWAMVRTDLNSLANAYGIAWQWNQIGPTVSSSTTEPLSDNELGELIRRIDTGGEAFRTSLTEAFGESRYDQTRSEGTMNEHVRSFKNATDQLRNQFDSRQPVPAYVERLLARAAPIDTYMRNNRLTNRVHSDWSTLRGDLNQLANFYNLATNWQNTGEPPVRYNSDSRLTGTFRLDASRSDNPEDVAQRATRSLPNNQRQMASDRLRARLESPEILAIERRGSTVTLASSRARQQTFEADGVAHQETISNRPTQVTATFEGDHLIVSYRLQTK